MAAQHLPRYLSGLAVDKRRIRSNERSELKRSVQALVKVQQPDFWKE